jgi:hypothetical protein
MESVLDKKQRQKLSDINNKMTDVLREKVMKDAGSSKLKQKVLDVISALRVESAVLNA